MTDPGLARSVLCADVHAASETAKNLSEILAIAIAGIWTIHLFQKNRKAKPRAAVTHAVVWRPISAERLFLRVSVTIENRSDVVIRLREGTLRVQQLEPWEPQFVHGMPPRTADGLRARLNELGTEPGARTNGIKLFPQSEHFVEPGETDTFHIDYFVPSFITAIVVYSHLKNLAVSVADDTEREIGWNTRTIHDRP